ncbi:MAG: hypothetical protein D6820_14610, partial [Lentisphaerae bacterium]
MSLRAILVGLLGSVAVCGLSHLNSDVLRQTPLVGNSLPLAVYGTMLIFVIGINPWLKKWRFSNRELAVILALVLAGSAIPGVMRTFFPSLVVPLQKQYVRPAWKKQNILAKLPEGMLVHPESGEEYDRVVADYIRGREGSGKAENGLLNIPWKAWKRPLLFWLPVLLALWIALIGLSMFVHRQWSENERLPYPIASFTSALLPDDNGDVPEFFRRPMFWSAAAVVFLIHLNNYLVTWFPKYGVAIPLTFDFTSLAQVFPTLVRGGGTRMLSVHLYFVIIGFAYLIPKEVSFSFGVGPTLWYLLMGVCAAYGINLTAPLDGNGYFSLRPQSFALFGANVGILLMILYTGRQYYLSTALRALGVPIKNEVDSDPVSILGFRIFLISSILLMVQMMTVG